MLCDNVDKMNDYNGDSEVNNEILIRDSGQPSLRQSKKSSLTPVTLISSSSSSSSFICVIDTIDIIDILPPGGNIVGGNGAGREGFKKRSA